MLEIRDDLGNVLATAGTVAEADEAIDGLCRRAHAQAVANREGTDDLWLRFEVIDTVTGEMIAFRSHNPDPNQPYQPLTGEDS